MLLLGGRNRFRGECCIMKDIFFYKTMLVLFDNLYGGNLVNYASL